MKTVLVTGGFDPLHSGHIEYFKEAKKLGDRLIVGVNSDEWLKRKKGMPFMNFKERASIIKELSIVDDVIGFNDDDGSANSAIFYLLSTTNDHIIFANGGDRSLKNIPEFEVFGARQDVSFEFGVGGSEKINSSSWILDEWKTQKTERNWGYWRVLDDKKTVKVKELVIYPNSSLSMQRHFKRNEDWYVHSGIVSMETIFNETPNVVDIKSNMTYRVQSGVWHKASNFGNEPCHVIEIQYGEECVEDDIERK